MNDLAKRITKDVLTTLKSGGDNLAIYEAIRDALAASPPEQPAAGREKPDPDWDAWLKPATDLYGPKDQT